MIEKDVLIDWFEFTIKSKTFYEVLQDFGIKIEDLTMYNVGMLYYDLTFVYKEKIKFLLKSDELQRQIHPDKYDDTELSDFAQGIHVILSGYACREWETITHFDYLIEYAYNNASQISRIDVAFDVFSNDQVNLRRVIHYVKRGKMVSKARKALITDERVIDTGKNCGSSVRIGSSASESMIMIYDKLSERKNADYIVDDSIKAWNRIEIRLRRASAVNFVHNYINKYNKELGLIGTDVLSNLVSFKAFLNTDTNRSRRPEAEWWSCFLNESKKLKLSNRAIQSTIQRKTSWVEQTCLKSVASVFVANLDYMVLGNVTMYLVEGIKKINKMSLEEINTYRLSRGASQLSMTDLYKIKEQILSLNDNALINDDSFDKYFSVFDERVNKKK